MFNRAISFNSDISTWDTSNVTDMSYMFQSAYAFNQDIGSWDTSQVTDMSSIFFSYDRASSFNQDLSGWCVTNITSEHNKFAIVETNNSSEISSALTEANKPVWGTCPSD